MHEENFLSSWLTDDMEGKAEEVEERDRKAEEERQRVEESEVEEGGR